MNGEREYLWNEQAYMVTSYDVDFTNRLKLSALLRFFQETAQANASQLGFGYDHLRAHGYFWALLHLHVELAGLPKWGETVVLRTWPKGIHNLFALRDYSVTALSTSIVTP